MKMSTLLSLLRTTLKAMMASLCHGLPYMLARLVWTALSQILMNHNGLHAPVCKSAFEPQGTLDRLQGLS